MKKRILFVVSTVLSYLFVFFASIHKPIDPDLGWHLKYGEYFVQHGSVLRENIFSTQMAGYHWANISWGMDVLYYLFYRLGGFFGLSLAAAGIVTLTFLFFAKAFRLDYWEKALIFPILLYLLHPINESSFRGQLVSLMLFGVLFFLIKQFEKTGGKIIYGIPLLFLLWANLHGLFLLGLAIFVFWEGLFVFSTYISNRNSGQILPLLKKFILITFLSFVATLIHPFGIHTYLDALDHLNNPLLQQVVEYGTVAELSTEWFKLFFVAVLAGIGITGMIVKKSVTVHLPTFGIFSILYVLSLSVRRYSWNMYYLVIPLLQPIAGFLRPSSKKGVFWAATMLFLLYMPFVLVQKYPFHQYVAMNWNDYCRALLDCSTEGAEALRQYYQPGKTMTLYNWGGWMIWNYPAMKPSTDGRMHVWEENGYSAFTYDYQFEQNIKDVDTSIYNVVFTLPDKPIVQRLRELARQTKWKKVYEDATSVIFVRNSS
jgi:hypothetical protein